MKKQRLDENEVRKLMKFANLGPLSNTFVDRLDETDLWEQDEEEELPPGAEVPDLGAEAPGEDLGDMDDMEAAPGAEPEGEDDLLKDLFGVNHLCS